MHVSSVGSPYRLATVTPQGVGWLLKRNCSLSPVQLLLAYGLLSGVSLAVALGFWSLGVVMVLPYTALELLALAAAFLWYARHAADQERIHIGPSSLVVEWESGGRLRRHEWSRQWVRVLPDVSDRGLVALQVAGSTVHVGRYLRSDLRGQLAREIRHVLHGARDRG